MHIKRWRIFQYWPLVGDVENINKYRISDNDFTDMVIKLKRLYPSLPIKSALIEERKNDYFFVNHQGLVYTVSSTDNSKYIPAGSVFDSNIVSTWANAVTS